MNNKIINPNRYKKVSASKYNNRKRNVTRASKNKIDVNLKKIGIVFVCIIGLILIYYISIYLSSLNYDKYITVFNDDGKKTTIDLDYDFKIGILNFNKNTSILTNELNDNVYRKLLSYDDDFNIEYDLLEKIVKIDSLNYVLTLKDKKYLDDIIKYLQSNNYNITNKGLDITVILEKENEYFPYYLNENIIKEGNYEIDEYNDEEVSYVFKDRFFKSSLKNINVLNYDTSYNLINDFKNSNIDAFLTSNEEDIRLIGKYEYNSKRYRNGETIFLIFDKNNEYLSDLNIRKVIASSINREEIVKNVSKKFTEVIDIPYINSEIIYKYDVYGSENILLNNGYEKKDGIYYKDGNIVSFDLIVNKEDSIKISIAESIKFMLEELGIRINILYKDKLEKYDLALFTVDLNSNPDISYLEKHISVNEKIENSIDEIKASNIEDLSKNIINLKELLYSEYACVGILAKDTHIIYQKNISGFDNIIYGDLFKDFKTIGKIIK